MNQNAIDRAESEGFLLVNPHDELASRHWWKLCTQRRIPFIVGHRGPVHSRITVDTDPTYQSGGSQHHLTEEQVDFVFRMYAKYAERSWRHAQAIGGQTVVEIFGIPSNRVEECLREIAQCLKKDSRYGYA